MNSINNTGTELTPKLLDQALEGEYIPKGSHFQERQEPNLLDQALAANDITPESLSASIQEVSNMLLTPEFVELSRESWFLFKRTPEWRAEAARSRAKWHAENP